MEEKNKRKLMYRVLKKRKRHGEALFEIRVWIPIHSKAEELRKESITAVWSPRGK